MLCKGDLAFFCNCVTVESLRLWAHERTRCAQVCFTGTEEDQAEQRDQGTIDEVLGDQDMEERGDALEEADREADLLEQMPLPRHPESEKERLAS